MISVDTRGWYFSCKTIISMSTEGVEEFGKKIGGDILCNKKTYLLIKAFELASEEDKALLKRSEVGKKNSILRKRSRK